MKILYALQGTGNGHAARAQDIVPHLQKYGEVDLVVSGTSYELSLPIEPKYKFKGLSYAYSNSGGIDYLKSLTSLDLIQFLKDVAQIPIEEYDIVINDFEPVSAWAARKKGVECVQLGHNASFISEKTPRPSKRDAGAEWILKNFAPSNRAYGFHFESYDHGILTPVIRPEVRKLQPSNKGHITVYLSAYGDLELLEIFEKLPQNSFHVFSKHVSAPREVGNVTFLPLSSQGYLSSLESCAGLLCGAGFEGPSEALFLGKKLMVIPIRGQYEQECNVAALSRLGIPSLSILDQSALGTLKQWLAGEQSLKIPYPDVAGLAVELALFSQAQTDTSSISDAA